MAGGLRGEQRTHPAPTLAATYRVKHPKHLLSVLAVRMVRVVLSVTISDRKIVAAWSDTTTKGSTRCRLPFLSNEVALGFVLDQLSGLLLSRISQVQ